MKIGSTPIRKHNKFGIDFKFMKKAGFNAIDIRNLMDSKSELFKVSDEKFTQFFNKLKLKLQKYDLEPYQMHGMWDTNLFNLDNKENWNLLIPYYEKAIKACSILDCKYLVIHPRMPFGWGTKPEQYEFCYQNNLEFIKELMPIAIKYNKVICIENMPSPFSFGKIDGLIKCIDEINDEHLKMCLDIGHYNVSDCDLDIYSTLQKIGDRVKVLHIHDNNQDGDFHLIPGKGNIDWKNFYRGLKDINFKGSISFETESKEKSKRKKLIEEISMINFIKKYL